MWNYQKQWTENVPIDFVPLLPSMVTDEDDTKPNTHDTENLDNKQRGKKKMDMNALPWLTLCGIPTVFAGIEIP